MDEVVCSQYRIPRALHDWLVTRAKDEQRSRNAQLVVELRARMQAAVEPSSPAPPYPDDRIDR
ncbi:hypothetical protein PSP20601_05435 [Pandoraea sputorum]|nr:hypothetical protein PSP20601_05435 [Pandoraea sputorum]